MPHQCHGHSHSGAHAEKADIFTNGNSIIGGTTSFLSMLFFVARLIDTFGDYEKRFAEMSYPAMSAGLVIALYAAIGSTICHRALNKQNQGGNKNEHSKSDHGHADHTAINTQTIHIPPNEQTPILQPEPVKVAELTNWHRLWLLGDFIGHASDVASPILFILLYAFEMQQYQKAISYAGSFTLGLFSSVASVRTCRNALIKENEHTDHNIAHQEDGRHSQHSHAHSHSHA